MYSSIKSQNLNFLEITSLSMKIFLSKLVTILAVILLFNLPVRVFDLYLYSYIIDLRMHFFLGVSVDILESFVMLLSTISIILIVDSEVNGNDDSLSKIITRTFQLWGGAASTHILQGLITISLFLLFIIPGVIWTVYYSFSIQVVSLKKVTNKKALDYSKFLVRGRWWKVFFIFLVYGLAYYLIFRLMNTPGITFGHINEINFLLIPLREIMNSFLTVITCVLFLNMDYMYGENDASNIRKPMAIDYFMSKSNSKIDDSEVDFKYDEEDEEITCLNCGVKLIESDTTCPACSERV